MNFILVSGIVLTAIVSVTVTETLKDNPSIPQLLRYDESLHIIRNSKVLFSDRGIVPNVTQCGGSGKVLYWRLEACTPNTVPCAVPTGEFFRGEIAFIPSKTSESMGAHTIIKDAQLGTTFVSLHDPRMPDSRVEAGQEYILIGGVILSPDLLGKMVTGELSIYRESDKEIEVCAEAQFLVV